MMQHTMEGNQHSPGDPFIGSSGIGSDPSTIHTKQESGDSGLGGMGNTFSLPRTPADDYVEDMDDGKIVFSWSWV